MTRIDDGIGKNLKLDLKVSKYRYKVDLRVQVQIIIAKILILV